jgi:hypothetical protein
MKKFCCAKFQFFYSGDKSMGLNIRIVKLGDDFIARGQLDFDKSFMITEGYSGAIDQGTKKMIIQFCPFCGNELKRYYKNDEYVQETINSY